jgi:hypothetical protein
MLIRLVQVIAWDLPKRTLQVRYTSFSVVHIVVA